MHATRAHSRRKTTPENVSCFENEERGGKYLDGWKKHALDIREHTLLENIKRAIEKNEEALD